MFKSFFLATCLLGSLPLFAQGTLDNSVPADEPSNSMQAPSRAGQSAMPTGLDTTGVPCGPGGCITANDQAVVPREAGAEGLVRPSTNTSRPGASTQNSRDIDPRSGSARSRPAVSADEQSSAFERFIEDTTGHPLPIYGRDLFLNTPADFLPATSVSPPAGYIIGSGDQLKVRAWGNVSIDVLSTVDRNGQIFVPQIGTVSVAGMHLDEARNAVRAAVRKQYESFELSVTLGQLRSIQVMVLGEARRPGVYTVSSLSTMVNALFASGGPSANGSLRSIELRRDGSVLTRLDVYDLLLHGDKAADTTLRAGDILWIPPVGQQVAVDGEVRRPGIYELRGNETAGTLVDFADGLTPLANRERATLDRIDTHGHRVVQDFAFTGAQNIVQIQNGDVLRLFPISSEVEQAVTLSGHVANPGRYPFRSGMRISDLIPTRRALLTRNDFNRQNALTPSIKDHPFRVSEANNGTTLGTTAAIEAKNATAAANGVTIQATGDSTDLVPTTEVNWRYAVIQRLSPGDLSPELISFDLGEAIDHPSSAENKPLEPGDTVVIYSARDLNLPEELRADFVRLDGEVVHPGIYRILPDETLRHLVARAGGLSPHAYLYAAQLQRESVRVAQEAKLQNLLREESQRVLSPTNRSITADGKSDTSDLDLRRAYIAALGNIHATGRVTLKLPFDAASVADVPDTPLQNNDHFFVPARPSTVDVIGNVYNPGTQLFEHEGNVRAYLQAAGNDTREADRPREFLLRADGVVVSRTQTHHFESLKLNPGDTIVVPARLKPGFSIVDLLAYAQVISSTALTAVAIRALD